MSVKRAFKSLGHEKRREGRKIFLFFPPSRGPPILESPRPSRGSAGSDTDNGMIASIIWFKLKLSIRSAQDSFARHRDPIIQGSLESRAKVLRFASRSGITLGPPCPLEINIVPEFQLARHGRTRSRGHESPRAPGRADRRAREREREGKAGGGGLTSCERCQQSQQDGERTRLHWVGSGRPSTRRTRLRRAPPWIRASRDQQTLPRGISPPPPPPRRRPPPLHARAMCVPEARAHATTRVRGPSRQRQPSPVRLTVVAAVHTTDRLSRPRDAFSHDKQQQQQHADRVRP